MNRFFLLITIFLLLALTATTTLAGLYFLRGGTISGAPYITDIRCSPNFSGPVIGQPPSTCVPLGGTVMDNAAVGTQISRLVCFMNTGAQCPTNIIWNLPGPNPSFLSLVTPTPPDGTAFLTVTSTPGAGADGDPTFDSNTFSISAVLGTVVGPPPPQIVSITPSCLNNCMLSNTAPSGTQIGTIAVVMNSGSFTGQVQLVTSGGICSNGDTIHFAIPTGTNVLQSSSTPPTTAGSYIVCVQAIQSSASNSPQYAQINVTVSGQVQQASPQVVNLTINPGAFVSSAGTVDTHMIATCLGACPGTPTYALSNHGLPSQGSFCSGSNNSSFTLTTDGHLTGSGLSGTQAVCATVTQSQLSNSGQIFELVLNSVASSTVYQPTLAQSYFQPGATFSSAISTSCQVNGSSVPYVGSVSMCTGVPSYTLDNTAGHCTQPNNTGPAGTSPTFAISGAVLSLTAPQTVVGNYYACVDVTMAGAANSGAPFQLIATISRGFQGTPQVAYIYPVPETFVGNGSYTGTLVAYCLSTVASNYSQGMLTPCNSPVSFSFGTTGAAPAGCNGGNDNGTITLSGPNNSVVTSVGAMGAYNHFPCLVATMNGTSIAAQYVALVSVAAPTLSGISAFPWYYSTAVGSLTTNLRPACGQSVCTGTPVYALDNNAAVHCTNGNNSLFTLNGSALTITTSTPGTYVACVDLIMTGAVNSDTAFPVAVTATTATGNCPATPPPQAISAGYTQLAYCLDASQPQYASVFNWINCAPTVVATSGTQTWNDDSGAWGFDCGTSETHPYATQVVDPTTGKTVLDFHWDGYADTNQSGSGGQSAYFSFIKTGDFPNAMYVEYKARLIPDHVPNFNGGCCAPDFFSYSVNFDQGTQPPGCVKYDPTNFCTNGGNEVDFLESGNGIGVLDAPHETAIPSNNLSNINCSTQTGCSGQTFFWTSENQSSRGWSANNLLTGVPFQNYTSFGTRFATDGTATSQYCYYWDEVLVQIQTASGGYAPSCALYNYTGFPASSAVISGGKMRQRHQLRLWTAGGWAFNTYFCSTYAAVCNTNGDQGPANQDLYLEYIAVWSCPNWNAYNQNNGYDSQPPCPVASNPYPMP